MTDREKLIDERLELSDTIYYAMRDWDDYIDELRETETPPIDSFEDFIADGILSAGYRKQKWIPVTKRLPDELPKDGSAWSERVRPSVDVLVKLKDLKELWTAWYSYSRKEWIDVSETHNLGTSVTHWMPLPEPPKEE